MYFTTWKLIFKVAACFFRLFLPFTAQIFALLPIIAVMFTFSFGSAMAATEYTLDDYANALTAEKTAQLGYMASAKNQVIGALVFDEDGFSGGYMKAAYEAAAQAVIDDAEQLMNTVINSKLNESFPKDTAPNKSIVAGAYSSLGDLTTATGMGTAMAAKTDVKNKVQAPLTKTFVEGKLEVDLTKYNSTEKAYDASYNAGTDLTAVQAVQKIIDEAKAAIATAAREAADSDKISGYNTAYGTFKTNIAKIKTLADEQFADDINAGTVEAAVEKYAKDTLDDVAGMLSIDVDMAADAIKNWSTLVSGNLAAFWEADSIDAKKGEFFGVAVANIEKVTRSEVSAVNNAYKAAVAAAKAPVKAYANGNVSKVTDLDTSVKRLKVLANAMKAVEKYDEVKAVGEKMKASYVYGVKKYDDAKVDQAVKAAEALVYADLNDVFDDAEDYIEDAALAEGITLEAENFEIQKFEKAIADAQKKMTSNFTSEANAKANATAKVTYGDNKTAEADLVYLKGTYDTTEEDNWAKIAVAACKDLKDAQSYDEINSIMAKAAEDFGKLLKAEGAQDVKDARTSYSQALEDYGTLKKGLLDDTDYPDANVDAAVVQGKALIAKATTLDAVKAAYEEAKALVDSINTADELKAAKEAVEKQIAALPYTSKLTTADKAAVKAAYEAYDAYKNMAGATDIETASKNLLKEKYNKVNELEAKAIEEKAEAINDKLDKLGGSDADVVAKAELKAEADAVKAEAKALKDEIDAVNEDYAGFLDDATLTEADALAAVDFADALADAAELKLIKATKDDATLAEMNEALAAYNALTDRQKYELDASVLQFAKIVENKIAENAKLFLADVTAKAKSAKVSKGIKVTVKADVSALEEAGFTVEYKFYRSTKKASGYVYKKTSKTGTYTNTAGKKGVKYYYKAKLVVKNAAGEVVAESPLKQCTYACRTWTK